MASVKLESVFMSPDNEVAVFAGAEWCRYVQAATGHAPQRVAQAEDTQGVLVLACTGDPCFAQLPAKVRQRADDLRFDGFAAGCCEGNVYVTAREPRGLLFGVYDLLEKELGLVFGGPHEGQEYIPRAEAAHITRDLTVSNPGLEIRIVGFHDGTNVPIPELPFDWPRMLDWMAKRKFNGFQAFCEPYAAHRDEILTVVKKRGLLVEYGGHSYPRLLPADELETSHPDFVAKDAEGNLNLRNFCFSNPGLRRHLAEAICARLTEFPEIAIFDLWPSDGAPFCECPECRKKEPAEWLLETTGDIARLVAEQHPGVLLAHLVYDMFTRPPEHAARLPDNVITQFCHYWDRIQNRPVYDYRQGRKALKTADETRRLTARGRPPRDHRQNCEELQGWCELASRPGVFSYYTDLKIKSVIANVAAAIRSDMRYYTLSGIAGFTDCLVLPRMWMHQAFTLFVLGEFAWDNETPASELAPRFGRGVFGIEAEADVNSYYAELADFLNEPSILGYNVLDLVHRSAKETALFAGVIERLVQPARCDMEKALARLDELADTIAARPGVNPVAARELRHATTQLSLVARRNFALYLAYAFKEKGGAWKAADAQRQALELTRAMRDSTVLNARYAPSDGPFERIMREIEELGKAVAAMEASST